MKKFLLYLFLFLFLLLLVFSYILYLEGAFDKKEVISQPESEPFMKCEAGKCAVGKCAGAK